METCHILEQRLAGVQDEAWRPAISVTQVLTGIQTLLNEPNEASPAQEQAYFIFVQEKQKYRQRVLAQAKHYSMAA